MKSITISRSFSAATIMLAALMAPSAQARMSKALNDTAQVGMNAIDHVLQRPASTPTFDQKRFGDHFFLSGGAALSDYGARPSSGFRPGFRGEISFGDWITPVHGWRVTAGAGVHSKKAGQAWKVFGSVGADYLMNFSSLTRGENPSRKVEFIGALGGEYQRIRFNGAWGNELALRASFQTRFNIQPSLYLYIEPRIALVAGTRFAGDGWRRFRPDASLSIGLGYRLLSKAERLAASEPFMLTADSHLFFGVGGGVWAFARQAVQQRRNPRGFGSFYVGKYFSPTAGLRVKAEFGRFGKTAANGNRYLAEGGLDFVWNLNSAFGGYRPDQVFDLALNFGPAVAYASSTKGKFYPGAEASLTALFRLSPNWGIYIEPEAKLFTRKFNRDLNGGGYGPMVSVMAGLQYTFGNFKYDHPKSYSDFFKARNNFLTFAVSPARRWRRDYGFGAVGQIGFGQRFSPISSWRVTAEGEFFRRSPAFMAVTANIDYLFSISTSMAGFNPDRLFDLSGLIGLTGGIAQYDRPINFIGGGRIGLHGAFRLNDALDLYIEPQLSGTTMAGKGNPGWTPEARVMLGLTYKLGTPSGAATSFADSFLADGRNFISFTGGVSAFSATFIGYPHRVGGSFDVAAGRWFSRVSGGRIGYNLDIVSTASSRKRPYLSSFHADYLLNVTSLMDRDASRRFSILGIVGAGVGFSNLSNSKAAPVGVAGLQFRYSLPANVDLHIEPNATFMPNRITGGYGSSARFTVTGRLMAGASYRF